METDLSLEKKFPSNDEYLGKKYLEVFDDHPKPIVTTAAPLDKYKEKITAENLEGLFYIH